MFDKTVTIIGSGPSGLTLARLLQMRGVTVRVFEHDASFSARDQGGTFDLHDNGGQKALIEAQLFDEFKKFARPEGQSLKVIDKHGRIHHEDEGRPDDMSRPEIDRQDLRKILLDSLEPGTVLYNKHLTNVESLGHGQHKLVFKDGTSEITDFLVGADGTWSKVRPLLTAVDPMYTGLIFVETRISNPKVTSPNINKLVGEGLAFVVSDNKGLIAQRNSNESIRIYVALRVPEDWPKTQDFNKHNEVRRYLLEVFSGWQPELLEMLIDSDDYFVPRHIYSLPLEESWTTTPGVTLIGDAAHVYIAQHFKMFSVDFILSLFQVMTPFAGQGANLAMLDALELAEYITSENTISLSTLTEGLKTFEETMISRARIFSDESYNNLNAFIAEDAPKQAVEIFKGHHPPE